MKDLLTLLKNDDALTDFLITMNEDFGMMSRCQINEGRFNILWKRYIGDLEDNRLPKLHADASEAFVFHGKKEEMNVEPYKATVREGNSYVEKTFFKGLEYTVPLTEMYILMRLMDMNEKNDSKFVAYPSNSGKKYFSYEDVVNRLKEKIDLKISDILKLKEFKEKVIGKEEIINKVDCFLNDSKNLYDVYCKTPEYIYKFLKENSGPLKLDEKFKVRLARINATYCCGGKVSLGYSKSETNKYKSIIIEKTGMKSFYDIEKEFKKDKRKFSDRYRLEADEACFLYDMIDMLSLDEKNERKAEAITKSLLNFFKRLKKLIEDSDSMMDDIEKKKSDCIEFIHFFIKHYRVVTRYLFDKDIIVKSDLFPRVYEEYDNSVDLLKYIETRYGVIDDLARTKQADDEPISLLSALV